MTVNGMSFQYRKKCCYFEGSTFQTVLCNDLFNNILCFFLYVLFHSASFDSIQEKNDHNVNPSINIDIQVRPNLKKIVNDKQN